MCRPWLARNGSALPKAASKIDVRDLTITCPAGEVERIGFGSVTGPFRSRGGVNGP